MASDSFDIDRHSTDDPETAAKYIDISKFNNIDETQSFDKFITIDRVADNRNVILLPNAEREFFNKKYNGYINWLWNRGKIFITLTAIAITIGCFAGFIQVFTETLVNWKTGYCTSNWLLNKSFCCSDVVDEEMATRGLRLVRRDEGACVAQGVWTNWSGKYSSFILFVSLSLLFGTISACLIRYVAPMATGSGISEIKVWVSGFEYQQEFLNVLTLIVKSVALPLTISSGLSIGKEGPSVHYAACCGFVVANYFLKDKIGFTSLSQYLTAASGAGVAVAFGAPIGGVLLGLEEIASGASFNSSTLWKSYYIALVAITTLKLINPFRNGKVVLFHVTYDRDWSTQEVPIFVLLGIFGGLYGIYVSTMNIRYVHFRKKFLSKWPIQEVVILVLFTSVISYFNEFLKLDMTEGMGILFHECQKNDNSSPFAHRLCQIDENTHVMDFIKQLLSLIIATIIRIHFTIVSYGAKVPAGIFVPSMAIGATFGRAVSLIAERFFFAPNSITPGAYAFLGAAATLCGITNLTLTVVVIMFELTGAFIYIIPTMIVVAMARIVLASFGFHGGIADQMVEVNGFPFLEESDKESFMYEFNANQIMSKDLAVLPEKLTVSELHHTVFENDKLYSGYPIVRSADLHENDKVCIGYILRRHILKKLEVIDTEETANDQREINLMEFPGSDFSRAAYQFGDIVDKYPPIVKGTIPVEQLFDTFRQMKCKIIMVEECGILQGVITRKDILRFSRGLSRELEGPKYAYDEHLNERYFAFIQKVSSLFGAKI